MKYSITIFVCFSFLLFGFAAVVQSEDCSKALILDRINLYRVTAESMTYLNMINESNWEEEGKKIVTNASAYGGAFKGVGNFDDFSKKRMDFFEHTEFKATVKESISYASQVFSDNALAAYRKCLDTNARSRRGFSAYVSYIDESDILLTLFWNPHVALSGGNTPDANIKLIGVVGANSTENIPKNIPPNQKRTYRFSRQLNQTAKIFIEGGGDEPFSIIAAKKPHFKPPEPPCEKKYKNDTVQLRTFLGWSKKSCNEVGECSDRLVSDFGLKPLDLACITDFASTNTDAIISYNMHWVASTRRLNQIMYNPSSGSRIIKTDQTCSKIKELAASRNVKLQLGVCSGN